ncbi:hypothetical protein FW778_06210 [Ginsengibacter hankyongi]|uniref:DUF6046 domain-containing protein n=1 Tax=Ginsengibacter hankyongi TaxID=2607284 RepID=A0A5J5ILL1_9BACT|nr:DUF6046 domain-containing protein [Ginsengibacter hankyongi]KAA9041611.1 hypothetical protein FW778_06210 [Ginsengibacter hankyongi]
MPDLNNIPQPIFIKSAPIAEIVRAFNIAGMPTMPPEQNQFQGKIQAFTPDKPLYMSPLGTPVMQDITFGSVLYTDQNTGRQRTTKPLTLINILFSCSMTKNIVRTSIPGRNGTIKEFVGLDDWQIKINGLIVGGNGHHPADEIIALKNQLIANVPIPVICAYLNNLDINNIVIKDITFEQEAGGYSSQPFTINALSDHDVLLQVL